MTTKLLKHHVDTLRLNPLAPWPQLCADTRTLLKAAREEQRQMDELRRESDKRGDTARVYTFNQNDCSQNVNRRDK